MKYSSLAVLCVFFLGACCCKKDAPAKATKAESAPPPAAVKVVKLEGRSAHAGWRNLNVDINALASNSDGAQHH